MRAKSSMAAGETISIDDERERRLLSVSMKVLEHYIIKGIGAPLRHILPGAPQIELEAPLKTEMEVFNDYFKDSSKVEVEFEPNEASRFRAGIINIT